MDDTSESDEKMQSTSESESDETMQSTSESEETMEHSGEEEMVDFENQQIRQKLRESGIIGRVLDDFMPCMMLQVVYPDKVITLGDQICLPQVQIEPEIYGCGDRSVPEFLQARRNGLIVMTDPAAVGGEYLHGLYIRSVMDPKNCDIGATLLDLVAHEPPRTSTRMIVFTLFTASESDRIYVPIRRDKFSTRDFADTNAFGPPLTAAFFYIKRENEKENGKCDNESPRSDRNGSPSHSKSAYAISKLMGKNIT